MHVCPAALEAACNGYRDPKKSADCKYELVPLLQVFESLGLVHSTILFTDPLGQGIPPLTGEQVLS